MTSPLHIGSDISNQAQRMSLYESQTDQSTIEKVSQVELQDIQEDSSWLSMVEPEWRHVTRDRSNFDYFLNDHDESD